MKTVIDPRIEKQTKWIRDLVAALVAEIAELETTQNDTSKGVWKFTRVDE